MRMRTYLTIKEYCDIDSVNTDILYVGTELNEAVFAYAAEIDPTREDYYDYSVQVWENGKKVRELYREQLDDLIVVNESKQRPRVSLRKPSAIERHMMAMNSFYLGKMYEQLTATPPLVGLQHFIKKDDEE